jgi:hypothetical protein
MIRLPDAQLPKEQKGNGHHQHRELGEPADGEPVKELEIGGGETQDGEKRQEQSDALGHGWFDAVRKVAFDICLIVMPARTWRASTPSNPGFPLRTPSLRKGRRGNDNHAT